MIYTKTNFLAVLFITSLMFLSSQLSAQSELVAPENVEASGVSPFRFQVKFVDNNTGEDAYEIFYSLNSEGPFEIYTTNASPGHDTIVAEIDAQPSARYYIQVRAIIAPDTYGPFSETVTAITHSEFPNPAGEYTTQATDNGIRLTWFDSSNEHYYLVIRTTNGVEDWRVIIPANSTSFLDTSAVAGITYQYGLSTLNERQQGNRIQWMYGSLDHRGLIAPVNLVATGVSPNEFEVTFKDNNSNEDAYEFFYSESPEGPFRIWTTGANPDSSVYASIGATPGTTYYIKARAFIHEVAFGPFSEMVSVTTKSDAPAGPTDLTLTTVGNDLKLTWTDNADNESGFEIIRRAKDDSHSREYFVPANVTEFLDTTVIAGINYYYYVTSVNEYGYGQNGDAVSGSVNGTGMDQPFFLEAHDVGPDQFMVYFQDQNTNEDGYEIQYSTSPDGPFESYIAAAGPGEGFMEVYVPGVQPNTTYFIRLRGYISPNIYSPYSQMLSVTTRSSYPAKPSNFTVKSSGSALRLRWTDNAHDEINYVLLKSANGGPEETIEVWGASTTEYIDTQVVPGVTYTYGLYSANEWGIGGEVVYASGTLKKKGAIASVHPNPATSYVELTFEEKLTGAVGVKIIDHSQFVHVSRQLNIQNEGSIRVNELSALKPGNYFIQVSLPDGSMMSEQLIVK